MNEQLTELVGPVVTGLGYELWGLEYVAQGRNGTLRVFIDSEAGIDVDDCAKVSRQLSALLDVEDPIGERYTLEVSSPGIDRRLYTLEQFGLFEGSEVKLRLKTPFEGRKRFRGILCGIEADEIVLRADDEEYLFPIEQIDRANVVPSFE